jgi:polar amino acid transport system substrate-binding protein
LATAENEPDILIAMIARSPARETQFRWVCPVLDYDVKLFRRRVRDDIAVRSIDDLKRWQVVGANGDVKTNYLRRQGIPVVTTADEDEAIRLLLYDRVDLMPGHPASMHLRLKALGLPLDTLVPIMDLPALSNRLYLAYGPQTPAATVDAAAAACAALIKDGAVSRLMIPAMLN